MSGSQNGESAAGSGPAMERRRSNYVRPIAGSALVTLLLLFLLGRMNAQTIPAAAVDLEFRSMVVDVAMSDATAEPAKNQISPKNEEAPDMDLRYETPILDAAPLDLVNVDLDIPSAVVVPTQPAVSVPVPKSSVARQTHSPQNSKSQPAPQPVREASQNQSPSYPAREKELKIEATVRVKMLIDKEGRVADLKFIEGPEAFQHSVSQVAWQWQFTPAQRNGQPIPSWATKSIRFELPKEEKQPLADQ